MTDTPSAEPGSATGTASTSTPVAATAAATAAAPVAPATPAFPTIKYDDFAKLELRVATVLEAREHPNANKLLLLKVRVGSLEKQIVAGIKAHYPPETLIGRKIIVVNNLEPAMLRGEESCGMLLAASDENSVVLLQPEKEIADGSRVK